MGSLVHLNFAFQEKFSVSVYNKSNEKVVEKNSGGKLKMTRKNILFLILLTILNGCAFNNDDKYKGNDPPKIISENRCGDGICDGPENIKLCPEDCLGILDENGDSQAAPVEQTEEKSVLAQVFFDVQVERIGGVGDCGGAPWGVDNINGGDFSCPPPKYWYNYELSATALQNLEIVPSGNGIWTITGAKSGGGTYQSVSASSDGQRICAPEKISGNVFEMNTTGSYQDNKISLQFETNPEETTSWVCNQGAGYNRETTLLLIDWGIAMSGDYTDLSLVLSKEDLLTPGVYQKTISTSMNPSPENRDMVEVTIDFKCTQNQAEGVFISIPCPWE